MMISKNALHAYSSSVRVEATTENCPVHTLTAKWLSSKSGTGERQKKGRPGLNSIRFLYLTEGTFTPRIFLNCLAVTGAYPCEKSAQNINKLKVGGARIKEISFPAAHKFDASYSWEQEKKKKNYCNTYLIHKY